MVLGIVIFRGSNSSIIKCRVCLKRLLSGENNNNTISRAMFGGTSKGSEMGSARISRENSNEAMKESINDITIISRDTSREVVVIGG
jgi:hypothetical protein